MHFLIPGLGLQIQPTTEPKGMPFEAVVVSPKGSSPAPGVLFPHGGPHSAYPAAYSNLVAFQAAQGYAVVCVNFRWGFLRVPAAQALPCLCGGKTVLDIAAVMEDRAASAPMSVLTL